MIYAPVLIPTLSRYEHLKRCIDSLRNNSWAQKTEIYISLDYPPTDKYIDGYKKVEKFLDVEISGFQKVHVFKQSKNLGARYNVLFLMQEVFKRFDRFIATEDDNEFSPNFLEFMDKGLEKFKDDPNIIYLSGYVKEKSWKKHNANVMKISSAGYWGAGTWKDKWIQTRKEINCKLFDKIGKNPYYIWKLYRHSRIMLWWYVHRYLCEPDKVLFYKNGELAPMDINLNIYCIIKNKYVVVPLQSMVRNWGLDGSGINCGANDGYNPMDIQIDQNKHFEFVVPDPFRMEKDNRLIQAGLDYDSLKFKDSAKVLQNWLLYELLGNKNYHKLLKFQKRKD